MQIQMRRVNDIRSMDRTFNGGDDTDFRDYVRDRYEKTAAYLEKASTTAGRAFLNKSREIFESINSSEALRRARASVRSLMSTRNPNALFAVKGIDDLRSAGYRMQRFLMADTVVRKKYLRQQVDGYSDTYVNIHGNDIGNDHYDYRRVIDGVFREEKDADGEDVIVIENFCEKLVQGDRDLDFIEQSDILDNWSTQRLLLMAGFDTTSRLGGRLD